jgi:hypothetical protein
MAQVINSFYDHKRPVLDSDPLRGLNFELPGKKLEGEGQIYLPFTTEEFGEGYLLAFHRLKKSHSYGQQYLAVLGQSIVVVQRLDPSLNYNGYDYETTLRHLEKLPQFLLEKGVPFMSHFAIIDVDQTKYLIKDHSYAPTLEEMEQLYNEGKVTTEVWKKAQAEYQVFAAQLQSLEKSDGFKDFARREGIYRHLHFDPEDVVYRNGTWVLNNL